MDTSESKMIITRTITKAWRIHIPKNEAKELGFKPGDVVEVRIRKKNP